jgi:PAS domain S-box-containing protein
MRQDTLGDPLRLLLIERDRGSARLVQRFLARADWPWKVESVSTLQEGLECLATDGVNIVLLGLPVPAMKPLDPVVQVCARAPHVPVLALVSPRDESLGPEAVQQGAQDYLVRGRLSQEMFTRAVRYAIERRRLLSEIERSVDSLQMSETNLKNVIENNADGIVVVNPEGKIVFVNPAAEALLGRSLKELLDSRFEHPLTTDKVTEIHLARPASQDRLTVEMQVVDTIWEGKRASLASLHDVTERKRVERMKDEFVSTVSHELRTPLTSMKGVVALMLNRALGDINPEQEDFLKTMREDIDRLAELINNILDLSKVDAGKMVLVRQRVHLPSLVEQAVRSSQAILGRRTIERRFDPVPDVFADAGRILQVLVNLLSNAVKFTQDEGGMIAFGLREHPQGVSITIADNGPGIPKEDQWRLFQKFEQVRQSWTERPKGTGLGLAICREIVDLHQGTISVQSELGKGTAFSFSLPVYVPASAFSQSLQDMKAVQGADQQGIGVVLVSLADVERCLGHLAVAKLEDVMKEGEETIRKRLSRNDRVLSLERSLIAILAVADLDGTEAIRQRMQKVCEEWAAKAVGKQGPAAVVLAAGHFPHDGVEPDVLLKAVRARLAPGVPDRRGQAPSGPDPLPGGGHG